ncbi:hypothetical protein MMA231_00985 [Asticcacaulis sp. MM231]|uniref:putative phage tail protein n=1 Tax=Asticcacaulis sp. MM231 TaxID=3157666 RepID=UPI0032D5797B
MNALEYLDQAVKLLPQGKVWQVTPDTIMGKLLLAFSDGMARVDARMMALLEEADPRTAADTIAAWETLVGLPDACTGELTDLDDRRAAVWQKYTDRGGQSPEHFKAVASGLGYDVDIIQYEVFSCESRCGDFVRDSGWAFAWTVVVKPVDEDTPELGATIPGLECIISRSAPSHTATFFDYPAAPVPTLYFDFTQGF